jgi:hypothetical protein
MKNEKIILNDVITPASRTIRNIPIPDRSHQAWKNSGKDKVETNKRKVIEEIIPKDEREIDEEEPRVHEKENHKHAHHVLGDIQPVRNTRRPLEDRETYNPPPDDYIIRPKKKRGFKTLVLLVVLLAIVYFVGGFFQKASIVIESKTVDVDVDTSLRAIKVENGGSNELVFKSIDFNETSEVTLEATGEKKIEEKAKGSVIIYNTFSQNTQKLIKNTRLESKEGLIYRIDNSVDVPGYTKSADGKIKAGQIKANIIADQTGDKYNVSSTSFTIPGFKGLPQYNGFSAENSGTIEGGFSGIKKIVDESKKNEAIKEMKKEIEDKINGELKNRFADKLIVKTEEGIIFSDLIEGEGTKDGAKFKLEGKFEVAIVDPLKFASASAKKSLPAYNENEAIKIDNLGILDITLESSEDPLSQMDEILIHIKGKAIYSWIQDESLIIKSLQGKNKTDGLAALKNTPGVKDASFTIRPIWQFRFPTNPDKFEIITK